MKTAGVALGITGSFLALYGALITFSAQAILEYPGLMDELSGAQSVINTVIALKWVLASVLFLSLLFGALGSVLFCRKGKVSGTLLVIAAVLSAATICGILSALCFTFGGIFAFVSAKRPDSEPQTGESDEYDMGI